MFMLYKCNGNTRIGGGGGGGDGSFQHPL